MLLISNVTKGILRVSGTGITVRRHFCMGFYDFAEHFKVSFVNVPYDGSTLDVKSRTYFPEIIKIERSFVIGI